jgi:hypothetical protein
LYYLDNMSGAPESFSGSGESGGLSGRLKRFGGLVLAAAIVVEAGAVLLGVEAPIAPIVAGVSMLGLYVGGMAVIGGLVGETITDHH